MDIEQLMNTINSLSAVGYERGFVSFRSDKGIIISPEKEFFKISESDIEIVGKERNVNKEKAIHLTAYERISDINVIIHVYPEYASKIAINKRTIYPYSATDARAIGAKLSCVIDNVYQICDSLLSSRAALTPNGLFVAGVSAAEALERVEMIERAAKIEYLINADRDIAESSGADLSGDNDIINDISAKKAIEKSINHDNKPKHLGYIRAKCIERAYLTENKTEPPENKRFIGGYGYYSRMDNDVLCASDVHSGEEIILNDKTAKNKMLKLLLSLYDGEYKGSAVVYNGENAVIMAGLKNTGFVRIDKLKVDDSVKQLIRDNGYLLINGYGVLTLGDDMDSAFARALELESECGDYVAKHLITA